MLATMQRRARIHRLTSEMWLTATRHQRGSEAPQHLKKDLAIMRDQIQEMKRLLHREIPEHEERACD
jgi:hypothetical protein